MTRGTLKKEIFSTMRYAQIHQQRLVFDIREDCCIENPNGEYPCFFYTWAFSFLKNIKILIFGGISKFPS
jgi:hypothetical protein